MRRDVLGQTWATAPGDLPFADVVDRTRARRTQFRHDNAISPLGPTSRDDVTVTAETGEDLPVIRARLFLTLDGTEPSLDSPAIEMESTSVRWEILSGYLAGWKATIPRQPAGAVVRYRIAAWTRSHPDGDEPDLWAHDGQGFWFRFQDQTGISRFAYQVEDAGQTGPEWARDGVIYHVFVDRFRRDGERGTLLDTGPSSLHGGDLDGVTSSLPYLQDLGVNAVWLSPVHPAETYHRYDGMDFFSVDERLGGNAAMRRLTAAADRDGMRVLMDFVPSHVSRRHPAFVAAQADATAPTASWFTFYDHPNRYRCFLDLAPHLPSLNTEDDGARRYLMDSAVQWLLEYGVSGFRLDHAIAPGMDFWVAFRHALRQARPDAFTVGEATDTPDSLRRYRQRLDAILDFPLARWLRSTFALGATSLAEFDGFLRSYERFMEPGPGRASFLDNHDMDRFLFLANGNTRRLRMAASCQFALQPTPIIYYGTEIGLSQEHSKTEEGFGDGEVRRDMIWDQAEWDGELLDFFRTLIHARKSQSVLRGDIRETIHLSESGTAYAFRRGKPGDGAVVAAFNAGDERTAIEVAKDADGRDILVSVGDVEMSRGTDRLLLGPMSAALVGVPA